MWDGELFVNLPGTAGVLGKQVFLVMGKPEVALGIVVANVADHVAEELLVVGEFSVFDVLADDVAEQASEVFVMGKG